MRSLIVFSLIVGTTSVSAAQEPVPASMADGSAPTILFVGTSLTAGYGLEPGQAFPARIQEKLDSLDLGYRVVNAGVAGEASAAARGRISSLLDEPFDVLVLETGAQDMLRRTAPDTIRANIAAIIAQVRETRPHARIVLLGMMAPPFFDREYAEQFGALYTDLAREHELPIVPFLLLGVGGVPSLNLADGFHPNAEGQRVVARNVWEVLAPVLGAAVADSAAGPPVAVHLARQDANSGRSAAGRRPAAVAEPGGVAGTISEAGTGRPVDGVRVWLEGTRISAMTGNHGRFMLRNVPAGEYILHAQSIGYEEFVTESVHIVAGATKSLDLQLKPAVFSLASIVVTPGRFGVMQENAAAPQTLGREAIETMPGLGEDIYRMVHRLPGVSADDYSARFAVRGGGNDEVLVRLDGLTLFEPFHLKDLDGALSIVDVQAVGGLDLTTGGFTAEYGNRMAGIFDMHTLRRPAERRTSAGISLTNARFMGIGTFGGDRGHYLLSARRGYLDVLLNMIEPDAGFTPRYHDVLAKAEYQPSAGHVVSLNVLSADDRVAMSDDHFSLNSNYGNHYAWLNWRMAPGDDLTTQTVVSVGRLDWGRNVAGGEAGTEITMLTLDDRRDFTFAAVRQDWTWRISDSHLVKWGAGVRGSRAGYDYLREQDGEARDGRLNSRTEAVALAVSPTGVEAGGHVAHRLRVAEPVTAELGIRYDHYSQSEEGVFSPRGNLAVALSPRTTVRAAWGLFHQPQEVYQLHVQDGDADFYRAQRAQHRVVGVDHALSGFTFRAEAYQRVLSRLRPRYDNLFNVNSGIEEAAPDRIRLEPTSGEARGIELFASSDPRNRLRAYASYTWARVEDVIDGAATPRGLDQRHSALVETGYHPSDRWSISSSWQVQSGRPYTTSTIATTTLPDGRPEHRFEFGDTYGERLAPYHRLDLRVTRQFDLRTSRMAVYVDVFNLYNRDNPRGWSSSLETDEGGLVRMDSGPVSNLPRLPSLGLAWNF